MAGPTDSTADNAPAVSPPRRLQFSLRSLVIVMVICGLLLGRYGIRRYEVAREEAAWSELQAYGADGQFQEGRVVGVSFSGKGPPPEALALLDRLPRLERLVFIDSNLDDAGLERIAELQGLEQLLLLGADITDDGLAPLAQLNELRILRLDNTQIGDDGLESLGRLHRLERLDLAGTRVTDAGLKHLTSLSRLERLYLNGAAVTEDGAAWLEQQLPQAKIVR
jgi:hypothetical protein